MIKAIIFDCWRTLFQQEQKPMPFRELATELGYNLSKDYDYLKCFEKHFMLGEHKSYDEPLRNFLEELNIQVTEERFEFLLSILKRNGQRIVPYENTFNILKELKGKYKLAILSNADPIAFKALLKQYNLGEYFDFIFTSYSTGLLKPNPDYFKFALKQLGLKNDEVLMVGDSMKDDIIAAENCKIKGILLDRLNKFPKYENRITSLMELKKIL